MTRNIALLFMSLLATNLAFAQVDTVKRTTTTVIFGEAGEKGSSSSNYNANAIKINVFGMFSGTGGITYEREFGSMFAMEIGGGVTFRNLSGNIWREMLEDTEYDAQQSPNFGEYLDEIDEDFNYDRRKSKIGTYFTLMPRYYFQEDGFDGSYLGVNFQKRNYKFEAYGLDPFSSAYTDFSFIDGPGNRDEYEKQTIIALCWGYNNVTTRTVLDMYTSFGINSIRGERIDTGYYEDLSGGLTPVMGAKMREVKKTSFFFELGFRFGFWWD